MDFYYGELSSFDLYKMIKDIKEGFFISLCEKGVSKSFENVQEDVIKNLEKYGEIYFSFGKRVNEYLLCTNDKKYKIDDIRDEMSEGIYMGDAYFNKYDDINLGFLISYKEGKINIKSAIEGESIECRRCEVVEDCGDLNYDMKSFIDSFIV